MLIRVLLAVESPPLRRRLARLLKPADALVAAVPRPRNLWAHVGRETCDLVVTTRAALPEPFAEAIATIRDLPDQPELVVVTDGNDPAERTALLGAGALAVLFQDLPDATLQEALVALVRRRQETLRRGVRAQQAEPRFRLSDFASSSLAMQRLLALALRVASADTSLLILGETGVGKEWLARAIHGESPRSEAPFIAVNCAALPEGLLESELFGHEKGAFTGAVRSRRGHFELAHGGTLFLDEIAEMSPQLQAKLLRALQERKIQRVGGEELIAVNVRIMAASNRDLEAAMAAREFRRDLYYRLGVVTLTVAPLRERREDIADLVATHLRQFSQQFRRPVSGINAEALAALQSYAWPGNVRELINVLERAVLLSRGAELRLEDLPDGIVAAAAKDGPAVSTARAKTPGFPLDRWLDEPLAAAREAMITEFEREYLTRALERSGGRVAVAAARAGIDPRTLYNKMRRYGLRKEDFRAESER